MSISNTKIDVWNLALDCIGETDAIESETDERVAAAVCGRHYDNLLRELLEQRDWTWALRQRVITQIDSQDTTTAAAAGGETQIDIPFAFLENTQVAVVRIAVGGAETALTAETNYTITAAADGDLGYITLLVALTAGQKIRITVTTTRVGWDHVYVLPNDFVKPVGLLYNSIRFSLLDTDSKQQFAIMQNDAGDGYLFCTDMDDTDFDALEYVSSAGLVGMMPRTFVTALAWRLAMPLAKALKKTTEEYEHCKKEFADAIDIASAHTQNLNNDGREPLTPSLAVRES